jgi:hypothetical protein
MVVLEKKKCVFLSILSTKLSAISTKNRLNSGFWSTPFNSYIHRLNPEPEEKYRNPVFPKFWHCIHLKLGLRWSVLKLTKVVSVASLRKTAKPAVAMINWTLPFLKIPQQCSSSLSFCKRCTVHCAVPYTNDKKGNC